MVTDNYTVALGLHEPAGDDTEVIFAQDYCVGGSPSFRRAKNHLPFRNGHFGTLIVFVCTHAEDGTDDLDLYPGRPDDERTARIRCYRKLRFALQIYLPFS